MTPEIANLKRAVTRLVQANRAAEAIREGPQETHHLAIEQELHNAQTNYASKLRKVEAIISADRVALVNARGM